MGNRTALFSRKQPGGVFTIADMGTHPGNIWFVQSGASGGGDTVGHGQDPDSPFVTLDYAVSQCTASNGDVIYLMPGHAETISTAALSPTLDVIGVKVIGLGEGAMRPTFTLTHVDANLIVSAASCSIKNVLFLVGVDSVVEVVDVNADDFTLEYCEIREGSALQCLTAVDINGGGANAADRCVVRGNKIVSEAAGAVNAIEIGAVQDGLVIEGNWISGDYSDAAVASGSVCTNMLIKDNHIRNVNAGDWAIELTAAATGMCVGNRLYSDGVATALDPGSLMCVDNLWVGAINQSSVPIPIVPAAVWPTGAIGAATFAAGAIDAAAIANDAIDATAIATNAIDADALAADAVDKIVDEPLAAHKTQNTLGAAVSSVEMCCEKSDGAVLLGDDPIFTIAGGPIKILEIVGIVTTEIGAGITNVKLQLDTTTPAATVELNAGAVDIGADAAGTSYRSINTTGIFTPVTAGFVLEANAFAALPTTYLAPIGTIQFNSDAARAGNIKWYLRYKPLSPNSVVTAAA